MGLLVVAWLILASSPLQAQNPAKMPIPSDVVFEPSGKVPRFQITLDPENLKKLGENPRNYVKATVVIDGSSFPEVGLRLKGAAGSFRGWQDRPALTLNFDKFRNGQNWLGLDKIHLNNSAQDGTLFNEILGSEIARAMDLPTARAGHAIVELNDKAQGKRPLGIYVLKEGYNRGFLRRNFPRADRGNLYDGGFLRDIDQPLELEAGEDVKHADLKKLTTACQEGDVNKRFQKVCELLDTDRFYTNIALQVLTCDWDGYVRNRNNYRIYFREKDNKAVFIPHGMDQLFGNPQDGLRPGFESLVARAIMSHPDGRKLADARLREMVQKHFQVDRLHKRIDEWVAKFKESVKGTPYEPLGKDLEERAKAIKNQVSARADYLKRELPNLKSS
ncbi:MAG: CotH kinase family protein [Gemmataceae bacterium]